MFPATGDELPITISGMNTMLIKTMLEVDQNIVSRLFAC